MRTFISIRLALSLVLVGLLGLSTASTVFATTVAGADLTVSVTLTPTTTPGGTSMVTVAESVKNNTSSPLAVTLSQLAGPNGTIYSFTAPRPIILGPGRALAVALSLPIPPAAPSGTYTLSLTAADTKGEVDAGSDSFTIP